MRKSLCILAGIFVSLTVFAQTGKITGKVTDVNSEALSGATVSLKGSNYATTTNYDGSFSLEAKAGRQTLLVSYVGFAEISKVVDVTAGQTTSVDFMLTNFVRMG